MENEHVKEFLAILKGNGKDSSGLVALLGYVTDAETQLSRAADELRSIHQELREMREERNHPVRTALQKAAKSLESNITESRSWLNEIKAKIIEGCKNAIVAFKQRGISALNSIVKFFRVRPMLKIMRNNMQKDIESNRATIAKIEAISRQYHSIGWAFKNLGRAIIGKKTVRKFEPNGKLAEFMKSPFEREIKRLIKSCAAIDKSIAALDSLEKAAPQKSVAAKREEDRPSTLGTMKKLQKQVDKQKRDAPAVSRSKQAEAAI